MGNPDLWDRGLVCFWGTFLCGLFTPTNPLPGHRFVPESHYTIVCAENTGLASGFFRYRKGWLLPSLVDDAEDAGDADNAEPCFQHKN